MSDLVAFVRARLDDDEAAALAAAQGPGRDWDAASQGQGRERDGVLWDEDRANVIAWFDGHLPGAAHAARHDPRRVLREVKALRAIVDLHELLGDPADYDYGAAPCLCEEIWPCATVKALAGIWRDHPDYDPAWKLS